MSFFKKNKIKEEKYDKENLIPIIQASICTGEMVVGFKDIRNGKFTEIMLIKDNDDLEKFKKMYGIEGNIKKEY